MICDYLYFVYKGLENIGCWATDKAKIIFNRIVTFLIIAPYKYSYLLTYLLTYLLIR